MFITSSLIIVFLSCLSLTLSHLFSSYQVFVRPPAVEGLGEGGRLVRAVRGGQVGHAVRHVQRGEQVRGGGDQGVEVVLPSPLRPVPGHQTWETEVRPELCCCQCYSPIKRASVTPATVMAFATLCFLCRRARIFTTGIFLGGLNQMSELWERKGQKKHPVFVCTLRRESWQSAMVLCLRRAAALCWFLVT